MDTSTVDGYVRLAGSDPEDTFRNALEHAGSNTVGPDSDGQYKSNCPGPSHKNGDRNPSLRWFKTRNSVVKFHCFGACEYGEVMKALDLRSYQLRPVRYEFDYFEPDGTYRFTVKRTESADDTKKIVQYRRGIAGADGEEGQDKDGNGLADGEAYLWLEPELKEFAEDCRSAGKQMRLWIPEGEKDTVAIAGSGSLEEFDFVTTAPGGAKGWNGALTARVGDLWDQGVLGEVVLVCDPDPNGMKRGFAIRDELAEALPDLGVRALTIELGQDVADLCDQHREDWVEYTRELTEAEITEALEEGTAVSGFMLRYKIGLGAKPGRRGMAIASQRDKDGPQPVIAAEFEPIQAWDGGWVVRVTGPRKEPYEVVLSRSDLSSKSSFDKWLVREARTGMVPRCGIGGGEVAQSLGTWLDWAADIRQVPVVTVTEHLTWVDPKTGEPAKNATLDRRPVWVSPDAEDGAAVRWVGNDRAGSRWGHEGSEVEAAWAWARALTFGDDAAVAAVAGWAGAMLLAPWLSKWMPTKPGLALIAPSGSGKTHGAARLILQLAGCDGSSTSSVAGLRRRLAQGGVSAIQWIDDSAILDDHHLKEILRVATSQSEHTLANPDAGATATNTAKLVGCVVVSAEGVAWAEETAMQDRFLFVRPANPQHRKTMRVGSSDLQWIDVQELTDEYEAELTRLAGWTVDGVADQEVLSYLSAWVTKIGAPKGRGDVGPFVAAIGARAIATWLSGVRNRAVADGIWPGSKDEWSHKRHNNWAWLVATSDRLLEEARDAGPRFNTLINSVIPQVLQAELSAVTGKGMTSLVLQGVDASGEEELRRSVYGAVAMGGMATAMPMVLIDREERLWVWTAKLADWFERTNRGKSETRITSPRALSDQMASVEDNPEWAVWVERKGGNRNYTRTGVRVGKRDAGASRAVYRRLSEEASRAVLYSG